MSIYAQWHARALLIVLLAALGCSRATRQEALANAAVTVFSHVNVVDVERGRIIPDQTVVIHGQRIAAVGASAEVRAPRGAQLVDGRGWYVIPGLWDMHAHMLGNYERQAPLMLANGITGIRQPGNNRLDTLRAVRQRIRSSAEPVPRLVAAAVMIDGDPPVQVSGSVVLTRADDASRLADSLLASGVDYFKVYARLRREPFLALAAEAKRRGILIAGHIPNAVPPEEMSDAGARSIEHIFEFPLACSARELDMRARRIAAEGSPDLPRVRVALMDTILATYDSAKCRRIAARLARNNTAVTPTLYLQQAFAKQGHPNARDSAVIRYFPVKLTGFPPNPGIIEFRVSAERSRELYGRFVEILRELHRAGVPILAGTDTPTPYIWTGFSLHDEMRVLVEDAGFTPAEALRTATLNPARYFMATDSMGTVASGKVADLVLLSADPLQDIRNTNRIVGVVVNGRYLPRAALDSMLARAEQLSGAPNR